MQLSALSLAITRLGRVPAYSPLALFTGTTQGVWYDPSDTTTLFQDAAGTLPVTAVEQPVGLMLDKSKGLALGSDVKPTSGSWTPEGSTVATSNSPTSVTFNASPAGGVYTLASTVSVGSYLEISYTISGYSAGGVSVQYGYDAAKAYVSENGTYTKRVSALGNGVLYVFCSAGTTATVTINSARIIFGNHAFNSSGNSANFPVLSARYNLLTKTEQFGDAAWVKGSANITANATAAPNGTMTADKFIPTAGAAGATAAQSISVSVALHTFTFRAKAAEQSVISLVSNLTGAFRANVFNLSAQAVSPGTGWTASITPDPAGNGWFVCSCSATADTAASKSFQISNNSAGWTGDGTSGIYIWGADLRVANDGVNLPAYQRVNTATDYDTVGFKPAEVFDGVDDNLIASAGGGSTTAFFWCSAIRVGKVGAVQTLFSDAGTNTGYRVRINASNQLELSAGNGTAYTTVATTATLSIGQRAVLTAWHDGTNLNVQINNGTVHQAAFVTATAGTAQFTIGKDNNAASNFFAGRMYEKVYTKDNVPSAAQITSTKTYVANIAGITLS